MIRAAALSLVAGLALPGAALGATITVTQAGDPTAADGLCSLREAVTAANTGIVADGCVPSPGAAPDTIVLGAGTYRLGIPGRDEDANATGDLDVRSDVTIQGAGAVLTTIDAAGLDRAVHVFFGATVRIEAVTLTRGDPGRSPATATGSSGGGIVNRGTLTVADSTVTVNVTGDGGPGASLTGTSGAGSGGSGSDATGAVGGFGGDGGGIWSAGPLTVERSVVSGNRTGAGGPGGAGTGGSGAASSGGVGTGGDAGDGTGGRGGPGGEGGGIWIGGGPFTLKDSVVSANATGAGGPGGPGTPGVAGGGSPGGAGGTGTGGAGGRGGRGGGVVSFVGLSVARSTVAANATGPGGVGGSGDRLSAPPGGSLGLAVGGDGGRGGDGGGIATFNGTPSLVNTTITGNLTGGGGGGGMILNQPATAGQGGEGGRGGGLVSDGGALAIQHATFSGNGAGGSGTSASPLTGLDGVTGAAGTPGSGPTANVSSTSLDDITRTIFAGGACSTTTISITDPLNVASGAPGCAGAVVNPLLQPLADNGGPVPTMRLAPGSPAIDRIGAGTGCAATDARGALRPYGGGCDVGAYEVAPPVATTGEADLVTRGSARISGTVETRGVPTPFVVEFGPTPAYGRTSANGSAGGGGAPTPVTAALSGLAPLTAYHYRVVALGADGTSAGADRTFTTGAVSVAGGGAPRVTGLTVRPGRFAVVPKGGSLRAARRGRVALGAVARFRLDRAARVTLVVDLPSRGRRVTLRAGRRGCVAVPKGRAVPRARRCTLHPAVGVVRRPGAAGANAVALTGRFGTRALAPGRYRLVVTARSPSGALSAPARAFFTVLAPP